MPAAGICVSAAAAMAASNEAIAAARAEQKRQYEQTRDPAWLFPAPAKKPAIAKCPACGSREWVAHAGKEVCAYCRSDRV
jgi:hypothetical protein